ncbi:unnamed protein product [Amaranthus hypochondriacus]
MLKKIVLSMIIFVVFIFGDISEAKVVRVIDALSNGKDVEVHCKSKTHDIGVKYLKSGEYFEFEFKPFFNTLYFCSFWYDNQIHWFDIYEYYRDFAYCGGQCWWKIKETGPCIRDQFTNEFIVCFDWNKN